MLRVEVPPGSKEVHKAIEGPSIAIVTSGEGTIFWDGEGGSDGEVLSEGKVLFVGAGTKVEFESNNGAEVYRAFVEA